MASHSLGSTGRILLIGVMVLLLLVGLLFLVGLLLVPLLLCDFFLERAGVSCVIKSTAITIRQNSFFLIMTILTASWYSYVVVRTICFKQQSFIQHSLLTV